MKQVRMGHRTPERAAELQTGHSFLLFACFQTVSRSLDSSQIYYVAENNLELLILQLLLPEDSKRMNHRAWLYVALQLKVKGSCMLGKQSANRATAPELPS